MELAIAILTWLAVGTATSAFEAFRLRKEPKEKGDAFYYLTLAMCGFLAPGILFQAWATMKLFGKDN